MTEFITGIAPQPHFPYEDLTEDNADLLDLLLANLDIVQQSHTAIERTSWIFKIGHSSIVWNAARIFEEDERLVAINHGVTSFEALTALVGGSAAVSDMNPTNREASRLTHMREIDMSNYFDEAVDNFREQTPRTAEVILSSSRRFHGPLVTYALLGAAMSRQFELSVAI